MRVERGERLARALHLRRADAVGRVDDLPLQVGEADHVVVDDADRADPGGGEIERHRRAEPAGADDQHARRLEALLAGAADLGEHDVARVALQLLGARAAGGPAWRRAVSPPAAGRHSPR